MNNIRVRIAPSPTGEDLHIGNAYTALINYIFAQKSGGKFIIRIEDTDRTRFVKGSEEKILKSLKWLGLKYDEGPDIKGPFAPYRQSERLSLYKSYAQDMVYKGKAYHCYCTPERLEQMRRVQQDKKQPTLYDGKCKRTIKKESKANNRFVIRLNVPDEGVTEFTDIIRGKISFENKLVDDQVLLKSDGYPTYHLGVVIDDYLMKISHVIRGEEWISSTPKHILIYKSLGWKLPVFAHLPLLRSPDKSKLSKRKNPVWVSWYREEGILPQSILNYLALMGWSMPDGRDKFSLEEMINDFRLEDVKTSAPIFDLEKLKWLNKRYIQELEVADYVSFISSISSLTPLADDKNGHENFCRTVAKTAKLVKPRISTLKEYDNLASFYHQAPKTYEFELSKYNAILKEIFAVLGQIKEKEWRSDVIGDKLQELTKKLNMSNSLFFMVLRVAVTGKKISPPLNESMEILGKKEILKRLNFSQ